jgi:uncharacterized iron-regulated membrane protein
MLSQPDSAGGFMRRVLFQLHLWTGLILGLVFVGLSLSGSIAMFWPVFHTPPAVQITAAQTPALDKALANARAALSVPKTVDAVIFLPEAADEPVRVHFGPLRGWPGALDLPDVVADPASGRALGQFEPQVPAWFRAIEGFHGHLLMQGGRYWEGWLGVIMALVGLSGLYLWWPKRGQWKNAFLVRRKAKGLRFHRELHGAVGIWTFALFMLVTVTGIGICFPAANRAVLTFVTGAAPAPRHEERAPLVAAPAGATRIGADAALAAARTASSETIIELHLPVAPDQPLRAVAGLQGNTPIYIDPYTGKIIADPAPPPSIVDRAQRMMGRLHGAHGLGTFYWLLVFLSGFLPLLFFVTGTVMWWKKRRPS